ncbi:MAG: methyltransferase domain-containing protein [Thermodesulfobacteriota bacterium]
MHPQHDLYFDRFQRFRLAAELLASLLGPEPGGAVLDVGGHDAAFAAFLPGCAVQAFDGRITRGAGLPLPDGAVDAAAALDVLEHVDPADRTFFLAELARVSRRGFALCFPVPAAAEAERFVCEMTGSAWLAEHRDLVLPDPDQVEAALRALGLEFERRPSASLPSWTAMMLLMHGVDKAHRLSISSFFNRHFAEIEDREPAYRAMYLCRKPTRP